MQRLEDAERLRQLKRNYQHVHGPQTLDGRTHNFWLSSLNSERTMIDDNSPSEFSMLWNPSVNLPMTGVNGMALHQISVPKELLIKPRTKLGQVVKVLTVLEMYLIDFLMFSLLKKNEYLVVTYQRIFNPVVRNLIYTLRPYLVRNRNRLDIPEDYDSKVPLTEEEKLKIANFKTAVSEHVTFTEEGYITLNDLKKSKIITPWLQMGSLRPCLLVIKEFVENNNRKLRFPVMESLKSRSPSIHVSERRGRDQMQILNLAIEKYRTFLGFLSVNLLKHSIVSEIKEIKSGLPLNEDEEEDGKQAGMPKLEFKTKVKLADNVVKCGIIAGPGFFEDLNVKVGSLKQTEDGLLMPFPKSFSFTLTYDTMKQLYVKLNYQSHFVVECRQLKTDVFYFRNRPILCVLPVILSEEDYNDLQEDDYYTYDVQYPRYIPFEKSAFEKLDFSIKDIYGQTLRGFSTPHHRDEGSIATLLGISIREGI